MKKSKVLTQLALVIGIVVIVNLLSTKAFFRLDYTADQRYTLSKATEDILADLKEQEGDVVNIRAYFSDNIPQQYLTIRKDLEDFLIEYEALSDRYVVYEFINPLEDEEAEKKAQEAGVQPIPIRTNEKDEGIHK